MKTLFVSCLLVPLLYPALLLAQDPFHRDELFLYSMGRFDRVPLLHRDKNAQFEWRDYWLRQLYPPAAFNQFAGAERLAPDFGQNKLNQTRSTSSPQVLRASNSVSAVREAWINHFSTERAPGADHATDIALDRFGNIYVTGYSSKSPFGFDFLTTKYDPSGKPLWTARYNGKANGDDYATAISVDSAGNVYVIGSSMLPEDVESMVTIKYDAGGVEQWAKLLNAPNGGGRPRALTVDRAGNVYVTASNLGLGSEYLTVKYNSQGVEQWRANYHTDNTSSGGAGTTLAVDREGNVFVAGASNEQPDQGSDFLTIKYNASGVEQWSAHYSGPGHEDDIISDIGIDALGNVYVMGRSRSNDDYFALVKYNHAGVQQWVAHFGAANNIAPSSALAVDGSGNAYVAAANEPGRAYTTIKYNANGVVQWRAPYDNSNAGRAAVADVALDYAGNVLVTGYTEGVETARDYTTVKYNASGVRQWAVRYNGPKNDDAVALAIDEANNLYVTGTSDDADTGHDYVTVKYNPAGQEQWVNRYNQEGNSSDSPVAMTMDGFGNIYITGSGEAANTSYDIVTIKYNREGGREWVARYDGPDHGYDAPAAIAVDNAGNVYITGSSERVAVEFDRLDYATIKYNPAGQEQWACRYSGPGQTNARARALAIDRAGNVYVTGSTAGLHPGEGEEYLEAYATVKYNADGVEQWIAEYKGPDTRLSYASAVAVDGAGDVYVSGGVYPNTFATLKYSAKGVLQWSRLHGFGFGGVAPIGLAIDGKNNIYLSGYGTTPGGDEGFMVVKYCPDGEEEWTAYYDDVSNGFEQPAALALDVSGNVYVTGTGRRLTSGPSVDYLIVKFDTWGRQRWVAYYNSPSNGQDYPSALAVDGLGNVYVTGASFNAGTGDDFATVKYNIDGVEEWVVRYNSPDNTNDRAVALVVDNWGDVYVTGKIGGYTSGYITTIKYAPPENAGAPRAYNLSQSFPNPFADLTNILFRLPSSGFVTLKIYDMLGQEVETLLNGDHAAGEYRLQWNPLNLPKGVYFYRLRIGDFVETKKLVFLK